MWQYLIDMFPNEEYLVTDEGLINKESLRDTPKAMISMTYNTPLHSMIENTVQNIYYVGGRSEQKILYSPYKTLEEKYTSPLNTFGRIIINNELNKYEIDN